MCGGARKLKGADKAYQMQFISSRTALGATPSDAKGQDFIDAMVETVETNLHERRTSQGDVCVFILDRGRTQGCLVGKYRDLWTAPGPFTKKCIKKLGAALDRQASIQQITAHKVLNCAVWDIAHQHLECTFTHEW